MLTDWRQQLLAHGRSLRREVYEHPLGVGVDFVDGCDAFWVLPGEVMSTLPVPAEGPASVDELIRRYDDIDGVRERALHVIRHHLAGRNIRVDRRRDGEWPVELEGGSSTSLSVGAYLTTVARDTGDVYAVVRAAIEHHYLGEVPTREQVEAYLATPSPPANEQAITGAPPREPTPLVPYTIRAVLGLMGLCQALDRADERTTAQSIAAAAQPTGRIAQAMLRLAQRLPDVEASIDLLTPGTLSLKFFGGDGGGGSSGGDGGDDYPGSFKIDTRSRDLARRIAADGPIAVGDQLADEYLRLRAARAAAYGAIHRAAAARGWGKDEMGMAMFGIEPVIYLGETRREVSFNPVELNELLRHATPEAALRTIFAAHPQFADDCVAALNSASSAAATITDEDDTTDAAAAGANAAAAAGAAAPAAAPSPIIALRAVDLRPRDIPPAPPLRALDAQTIAQLDAAFAHAIHRYLASDNVIYEYRNRDVYAPAIDTWATQSHWVRIAGRHVVGGGGGDWINPTAILILLDAGDPRGDGDDAARRYLDRAQPHHEVSDAEVEIVWRYRHARPETARAWFAPVRHDDVPFFDQRALLGDPVAARKAALRVAVVDQHAEISADDITPAAAPRLSPPQQDQLHRALLEWARHDHHWSPPHHEKLRLALAMGWRDVADAIAENPYALPGLLTIDRRSDGMDEPGMLLAGPFLLVWSRLAPSSFLAQLIATAHNTDLVALAEEAARRSAVGKPEVAKMLAPSFDAYRQWRDDLEHVLAIAWTRCRPLLR